MEVKRELIVLVFLRATRMAQIEWIFGNADCRMFWISRILIRKV